MKILHFSDIHVNIPLSEIPLRDWFGKRAVGGANHLLRRRKHFLEVPEKMRALQRFAQREQIDLALCSGDYTVIGTVPEFRLARTLVEPFAQCPQGFITIPGNHDIYTWDSIRERRFENVFGEFMQSDINCGDPDLQVRLFDHLAVVSVCSVRPNPPPWRSSGRVTASALEALTRVLALPELAGRFVLLMTHYAMCQYDGRPDSLLHRLENVDELLQVARTSPSLFLVHGHVHRRFSRVVDGVQVFGAGSTTQSHREGFWCFDVTEQRVLATPGRYAAGEYCADEPAFSVFAAGG